MRFPEDERISAFDGNEVIGVEARCNRIQRGVRFADGCFARAGFSIAAQRLRNFDPFNCRRVRDNTQGGSLIQSIAEIANPTHSAPKAKRV
jgi:hypothetical protein